MEKANNREAFFLTLYQCWLVFRKFSSNLIISSCCSWVSWIVSCFQCAGSMMVSWACFFLILFNTSISTILIGYPAAMLSQYTLESQAMNYSFNLWQSLVNNKSKLAVNGIVHKVQIVSQNCYSAIECGLVTQGLISGNLTNGTIPHFMFAPYSSALTEIVAPLCEAANVWTIY